MGRRSQHVYFGICCHFQSNRKNHNLDISDLPSTLDGQLFSVYVIVTDENGNQDWVFDEIAVYANPVAEELVLEEVSGGCGSSSAAAFMIPIIGLAYSRRRRKIS